MKTSTRIGAVLLGVVLCVTLTYASDPTAVYTRVERVVLEPNAEVPQAIQVWGVFAMAKPDDRNDYLPPMRGYLYFTFNGTSQAVRPCSSVWPMSASYCRPTARSTPQRGPRGFRSTGRST